LNTIRSNPEIVPLTKFENLSINDFMSRLLLLDGCFAAFIFSKKGGSCHLGFGLRASPALVQYKL
jgi:hypothetical protein